MSRAALAVVVMLVLASGVRAEIATKAVPIYHGFLRIRPAVGTIDRRTGNAIIRVTHWALLLDPEQSDGIYPDKEPIIVAIGNDTFFLPAGALHASTSGKSFSYRSKLKRGDRGIASMSIRLQSDGSYGVRFILMGADLSSLIFNDPACMPMAVIVGNDDGFSGVDVTTAPRYRTKLRIPDQCDQVTTWPWT